MNNPPDQLIRSKIMGSFSEWFRKNISKDPRSFCHPSLFLFTRVFLIPIASVENLLQEAKAIVLMSEWALPFLQ